MVGESDRKRGWRCSHGQKHVDLVGPGMDFGFYSESDDSEY